MSAPLVSVVIPSFARPRQLASCLEALVMQTIGTEMFEVVVVDDGSPEPLDVLASRFDSRMRIRILRQANAGPAAARNRGVAESHAALVAFTDDDCRPLAEWLGRLVARERDHPGALVGGSTINGLSGDLFATTSQLIVDLVYEHFNADPDEAFFFASNNMLCRRDDFLRIGGFDAAFPTAGAEDRDFCDRWRAAGLRLVSCPEAIVEHRHAQSLWQFVELHYRYGRGARLYQTKRRDRGSGTMRNDLGFHRTLPGRMWRRFGRRGRLVAGARVAAVLLLWEAINAVGFLAQVCGEPWAGRPVRLRHAETARETTPPDEPRGG